MAKEYDVIIIGGGVVGCMIARFLSQYQLDILLIEKEIDIGMGTSSANSAVIHAGYNALPGTLKANRIIFAPRSAAGQPYSLIHQRGRVLRSDHPHPATGLFLFQDHQISRCTSAKA